MLRAGLERWRPPVGPSSTARLLRVQQCGPEHRCFASSFVASSRTEADGATSHSTVHTSAKLGTRRAPHAAGQASSSAMWRTVDAGRRLVPAAGFAALHTSARVASNSGAFGLGDGGLISFDFSPVPETKKYDLVVVGGGSGGLAAAREAASLGKSVAVLDYVAPSSRGTVWGLGGTCVNVGCIPKKLMRHAGELRGAVHDAATFGWSVDHQQMTHDWKSLVDRVQSYVRKSNFGYQSSLLKEGITYLNARGRLEGPNTVRCFMDGADFNLEANHILVAVGSRPTMPAIVGATEHCITSDDLFSLPSAPGKTLVVGASYVGLECAGFLTMLGQEATVMARSILLRGYDQEMAAKVPHTVERTSDGRIAVHSHGECGQRSDVYDTVLLAVGRRPATAELGLEKVGVLVHASSGRILGHNGSETTNIPSIHAVGDVLHGVPELTPTAIHAGRLLMRRLFGGSKIAMDYQVPTSVFTPQEYSFFGMSEEQAIQQYGADGIEVYHSATLPLDQDAVHQGKVLEDIEPLLAYVKLIFQRQPDGTAGRALGLHVLGPHAGDIVQGFAMAIKMGATKADFDNAVGIHPTFGEELLSLTRTKRSGVSPIKTSC